MDGVCNISCFLKQHINVLIWTNFGCYNGANSEAMVSPCYARIMCKGDAKVRLWAVNIRTFLLTWTKDLVTECNSSYFTPSLKGVSVSNIIIRTDGRQGRHFFFLTLGSLSNVPYNFCRIFTRFPITLSALTIVMSSWHFLLCYFMNKCPVYQ